MPVKIPGEINSITIDMSDAANKRPILAVGAARIFATWSSVEFALGSMASVLIGDSAALAILDSIRARNSQLDGMKAALNERIKHQETAELLKAVFKLIERAARPRNSLAHCLWGTIPELPDALLLSEPKAMLRASRLMLQLDGERSTEAPTLMTTSFEHAVNGSSETMLEIINLMRDNTEVWRQADFQLSLTLLNRAIIALTHFTIAISTDPDAPAATQARSHLKSHLAEAERLQ